MPKISSNGNRTQAAFDTLGLLVGTAVMGKSEESLGDTLAGCTAELGADVVAAHLAAPLANPQALLQSASTRLVYDLFAYQRTQADAQPQPAVVCTLARETHVSDLAAGAQTRVQQSFVYSDGFGREIQTKIPAEPDADARPRWEGSGWTVANNKGQPVRRFEPFFSSTHVCEFVLRNGVSPVLLYDPLGRVVATLHPNHTWEKVVFDAWRQATWDSSDTVLLADPATDTDVGTYIRRVPTAYYLPTWHAQRIAGDQGTREQAAAQKTAVHAATPALAHFDALGRPFLSVAHNRVERQGATLDEHHATRVELDIEGEQRAVRDAIVQAGDSLGRVVMRYDRDLLGRVAHSASMEAGERWILTDVAGQALRAWDSRGHALRSEYDALRWPLRHFVRGHAGQPAGDELLYGRSEYGEGEDDALARNLGTRVLRVFDGAGVVTSVAHDFKGNLLQSHRQLDRPFRP